MFFAMGENALGTEDLVAGFCGTEKV